MTSLSPESPGPTGGSTAGGRLIESGAWRSFVTPQGRPVNHPTFAHFVATPRPDGLGSDLDTVRDVCRTHEWILDLYDEANQRSHGGDRRSEEARINGNNIPVDIGRPEGTSPEKALRRLRKDRPDLLARVIAGELSPHAAAIEAGHRTKTITVPLDPERAAAGTPTLYEWPLECRVVFAAATVPRASG